MKRLFSLLAFMIATTVSVILSSCENSPWTTGSNYDSIDSAYVAAQVENVINPVFSNTDELLLFKHQTVEGYEIDSTFNSIPDLMLIHVGNVVLKRNGYITKREVVYEYKAHKDIYEALPPPDSQNHTQTDAPPIEVNIGATDLSARPDTSSTEHVISTEYRYLEDTIDGKPVKVQVKTTKTLR